MTDIPSWTSQDPEGQMKLYSFREANYDRPDWASLQAIANRTAERAIMPTIDVDDFMWMCEMKSLDGGAPLHL